jgi:phosphoglycolate phosphatase
MMVAIACKDLVFNHIEAVIFDKDGTLENSHAYWYEVGIKRVALIDARFPGIGKSLFQAFGILKQTLDPMGLMAVGSRQENEIAAAAYIAQRGCSWFEAKQIAGDAFNEAAKYFTKTSQSSPLFIDSLAILQSLNQAGLKIGILSADSTSEVEAFVDRHQLREYIQLSMGCDREIYKPNPQLLRQACERLKVKCDRTIMVGDSWGDLAMAKNAGAAAAIYIQRDRSARLTNADVSIASLSDIVPLTDT